MNAKKILALVLAAMMAVGTSVTAFAVTDTVSTTTSVHNANGDMDADRPLGFADENVYVERDGVLIQNPDEYRPGDTIYIRLSEYTAQGNEKPSDIEEEKDDMNVYATWKVGKDNVESIDIVYRKGEFVDGSIDVHTGFNYLITVDVNHDANQYFDQFFFVPGDKPLTTVADIEDAIKKSPEMETALAATKKTSGYVVGSTWYETLEEALEANGYTATVAYSFDNGLSVYENNNLAGYLTSLSLKQASGSDIAMLPEDHVDGYGKYVIGTTPAGYDVIHITDAEYVNWWCDTANSVAFNKATLTTIEDLFAAGYDDSTAIKYDYHASSTGFYYNEEDAKKAIGVIDVDANTPYYVVDGKAYSTKVAAINAFMNHIHVNSVSATAAGETRAWTYWVEIKTKEDDTTGILDLAGTIYVGSSKNKAEDSSNYFTLDTSLSNRYEDIANYANVDDEVTLEPDSRAVVSFADDAEDVIIYFGDNEAAWYEFDARGQDALNFEWTLDFNREIADLFPNANIDFITWKSEPSTNRTGDLYITADADTFIYEVTEDGVREIANAEYDEDEEAWHIRTRKLTAYAISDRELDTSKTLDGETSSSTGSSSTDDGNKANPDTGR